MKKFKFRLQSVLNAREKALEDCQLAMAKVQQRLNEQINRLEYLYETLKNTADHLEKLLSSGQQIDIFFINNYQSYIVKLKESIKNQHKIIADTEVELSYKKQEVMEALKAKTMLEKLKEKDLKEFNVTLEKLDLKEIDEIATNRHKK